MKSLLAAVIIFFLHLAAMQGQQQPYLPGEKINYQVRYGFVNGGIATMELKEGYWDGVPVWHAIISGQTTGLADAVYKVRDTYESYIEPSTDLPLFSIRNISEGRYRKYNEVTFDHRSRPDSAVLNSDLSGRHITQKGILDILSSFYWFRKHYLAKADSLKPGDTYTMMTWFADELYPITLKYRGKEMVKIREGKILCYRFHPVTEVGRVFKTEEDMAMWFSADENFLPVKVRFDIFVGSFYVDMVSSEGLKTPLVIN